MQQVIASYGSARLKCATILQVQKQAAEALNYRHQSTTGDVEDTGRHVNVNRRGKGGSKLTKMS